MIRVSLTFIRPNPGVAWWFQTPDGAAYTEYRMRTYASKVSDPSHSVSSDGLTWTYDVTWTSRADWNAMMADPNIQAFIMARKAYDAQNNITEIPVQITDL